ncbi:MAG: AraC family transcriptional regulator [Byssovorax sp.]
MSTKDQPGCAEITPGRDRPVFVAHQHLLAADTRAPHPATHDHLVLAFCLGGSLRMEQVGSWSLTAGDALLIPAGAPHRLVEASDSERWVLGLCPACFAADGNAELLEPFDRVRSGASAVVHIPAPRRAFLASLFHELQGEIERVENGTEAAQRSLVTLVLTEVARAMSPRASSIEPPGSVVAEALRFIERRCLDPISLQDVADAVHRSPAHVTTLVRRATGRPVQAWIIAGRLAEATRRLRHTDEIVDVIAERVGYADATHFIRLFRREHGITPAAWRSRQRSAG